MERTEYPALLVGRWRKWMGINALTLAYRARYSQHKPSPSSTIEPRLSTSSMQTLRIGYRSGWLQEITSGHQLNLSTGTAPSRRSIRSRSAQAISKTTSRRVVGSRVGADTHSKSTWPGPDIRLGYLRHHGRGSSARPSPLPSPTMSLPKRSKRTSSDR